MLNVSFCISHSSVWVEGFQKQTQKNQTFFAYFCFENLIVCFVLNYSIETRIHSEKFFKGNAELLSLSDFFILITS